MIIDIGSNLMGVIMIMFWAILIVKVLAFIKINK